MWLLGMSHVFYRQDNDKWIGEGEHAKPVVRHSQFWPKIMISPCPY